MLGFGARTQNQHEEKETHDGGDHQDSAQGGRRANGGGNLPEVNISEQTFYRWRRKYGRMEMADAKRFKELENENSELKKMLADEMLKNRVLNETLKKKW